MKSLELAAKSYQKKERIVLADMLPNVALSANYLVTNPNAFNGFKNEFAGMFNVGVMMKVPLSGWWEGTYKSCLLYTSNTIACSMNVISAKGPIRSGASTLKTARSNGL